MKSSFDFRRLWPLALVVGASATVFATGVDQWLTLENLRANREALRAWVDGRGFAALFAFVGLYAAGVLLLPPSGTLLTLAGGFVFGAVAGTMAVVMGATIGATLLFLVARHSLGDLLRAKAGPGIRRMEEGFRENQLSYMLVLRLVPLFPFWLVNIAPAFLGVSARVFVFGTFLGIIPGTAVYASLGAGLGEIFDAGGEVGLAGVFTPTMMLGLIGLALLALLPVAWKKWKKGAAS